jgi:16S rRNA (cytosine967-C5)-methyltransferase
LPPDRRAAEAHPGAAVRAVAARINVRVTRNGASLEAALAESGQLEPREAALLRALSFGLLRWHHRLQWQAGQLLSRPLSAKDAELASLLRLGLFQLQWLRIPDHAAVSATVAAAELVGAGRAKGLINAVLRRFQRERAELTERMADNAEAQASHPGWLLERLRADWPQDWQRIVEANNQAPPMWLRVNARHATRAEYLARLASSGIAAEPSPSVPSAVLVPEPRPMSTLPGFAEGAISVQDAAAQLAPGLLRLKPGLRVLDACAAPGGKTAHILESCPELAELVALDRDAGRLEPLGQNLERLGLCATVRVGEATEPDGWWDGRVFDRILLDAPCTALGVIRRHPDIKLLRRPRDVPKTVRAQAGLLAALWPLLAEGGRLLYSTCTVLKEENDRQITRFLEQTPAARLAGPAPYGGRQILPGEANMDGFYYACLDRQG